MKSEIAWLMEAFLEEDPKKIRVMIKDRMAEVTDSLVAPAPKRHHVQEAQHYIPDVERVISVQPPSMQRIMQNNPDLIPKPPVPVTPAAAQALAAREALLKGANKDKPEQGRTGPRKA